MINLTDIISKPRKSAKSYAELLPWFGVCTPGLVLCQDGSLLAGFTLEGQDVLGKMDAEVDQQINRMELALRTLNDRITMWSVRERRFTDGYPFGTFTSPVAELIDDQWGGECQKAPNARITQTIFLGYNFPNISEAFFEAVRSEVNANDGNLFKALASVAKRKLTETNAVARVRGQLDEMALEFEKAIASFTGVVEQEFGFARLFGPDLLGALHSRANLASIAGPVNPGGDLVYLDTALAADTVTRNQDVFTFEGINTTKHVAALSMMGTPPEAHADQLDRLMNINGEFVLVQCFKFLDRMAAEKEIQGAEQFYRHAVKSVGTRVMEKVFGVESEKVNTGNLHLADDAQAAMVELTASEVQYGYYNMTVLALGDTRREMEDTIDMVASSLRASGYNIVRERQGLLSAILATLPGSSKTTLRWKLASTANLADMLPIRTVKQGEETHPFISKLLGRNVPPHCRFMTPMSVPYDFNPHQGDVGHTGIIGGTGAGKTTLMTLIIAQFQKYAPSQTFIFDKDYSLMVATVLLGGKHIDMESKSRRPGMNPVKVMLKNGDDARLREWVEVLIGAGGHTLDTHASATINTAIQSLMASSEAYWRLSSLYSYIKGVDADLAAKLAPYVNLADEGDIYGEGPFARYFDNDDDNFELSNIVGMECGGILENNRIASPFLEYAFYCIDKRLTGSVPTLIYLEEAWYALANPFFYSRIVNWLRTFRKKKAFLMFATQSADEIARLDNVGAFTTNIPTKIFLPSITSNAQEMAPLYNQLFGTNEAQIDLLSYAIPKRDYLIVKPTETRLVNTSMPPVLLAINDATSVEWKRGKVYEYAESGEPGWEMKYIKEVLRVQI